MSFCLTYVVYIATWSTPDMVHGIGLPTLFYFIFGAFWYLLDGAVVLQALTKPMLWQILSYFFNVLDILSPSSVMYGMRTRSDLDFWQSFFLHCIFCSFLVLHLISAFLDDQLTYICSKSYWSVNLLYPHLCGRIPDLLCSIYNVCGTHVREFLHGYPLSDIIACSSHESHNKVSRIELTDFYWKINFSLDHNWMYYHLKK